MAIRTIVTRGYGNSTFNGTIALVVTRGYSIATGVSVVDTWTLFPRSLAWTVSSERDPAWTINATRELGWTLDDDPR